MDPPAPTLYPSSPLAFVPLEEANPLVLDLYLTVFVLGILVWDILCHDHQVFRQFKIRLPLIVYILSRIPTFTFIFGRSLLSTYPFDGKCNQATLLVQVSFPLSSSLTSLLFLYRVRGVFGGDIRVVSFFGITWLLVTGCTCLTVPGMGGSKLLTSRYCTIDRVEKYIAASFASLAVFDTLVLSAVSWRLYDASYVDLGKENWWRFFRGQFLPQFSRALLRDGQVYYCVVVVFNVLQLAMLLAPVPIPFHDMFSSVSICLTNVMACRVFRQTRKALVTGPQTEIITTNPVLSFRLPSRLNDARHSKTGTDIEMDTQSSMEHQGHKGIATLQ